MKEPVLRKWHRHIAVLLAPLVLLQAISGLLLSIERLYGFYSATGRLLPDAQPFVWFWDSLVVGTHYGGGRLGAFYHILLGMGLVWLATSGLWIFVKIRTRTKKR